MYYSLLSVVFYSWSEGTAKPYSEKKGNASARTGLAMDRVLEFQKDRNTKHRYAHSKGAEHHGPPTPGPIDEQARHTGANRERKVDQSTNYQAQQAAEPNVRF